MREPLPTAELDDAGHSPDSLSEAIQRADLAALWRAISELPHQQREALLLREFGGLTYEELAEALAVTGPAVESLLFRARQGLRARLQTAYAAVSGASLAEALARLLAGASGSAAPVVAKTVAAAGVGAALATGGVVVAPHVFHHDAAHPRVVPITPSRQTAVVARRAPALVANRVQADDRGSSSGSGRSSGDRPDDSSAGSADEQQRTAVTGDPRSEPRTTEHAQVITGHKGLPRRATGSRMCFLACSGGARLSRWGRRTLAAAPSIGGADPVEGAPAPEADLTRTLYEQYANQIFRYCLHQLGSREEAEDAVQSTFLNAFRGIKRGIVPELESAWLFKIAHNVCLSRRRSSWRRGRVESPADFEVVEELTPAPPRRADELMGLQDVLEEMPENQRRAILLREWQGLSYREIAEELSLSQAAVETLIFRARRALAAGLEQPPEPRRRIARGTDLGNVLAGLKTLLLGGGAAAKVAATVAVVSASTVVAAAPVAQHERRSHTPPKAGAPASLPALTADEPAPVSSDTSRSDAKHNDSKGNGAKRNNSRSTAPVVPVATTVPARADTTVPPKHKGGEAARRRATVSQVAPVAVPPVTVTQPAADAGTTGSVEVGKGSRDYVLGDAGGDK